MKDRIQMNTRMSKDQYAAIVANAAAQGVTPCKLMRDLGTTGVCTKPSEVNYTVWRETAGLRACVNQNTRTYSVCRIKIEKGELPEEFLDVIDALEKSNLELGAKIDAFRKALGGGK